MQDADDLSMPRRIELQLAQCESVQHSLASASKDDPARALSPPSLVLVGCSLQRFPLNATPRWTRWGYSQAQLQAQLLANAIREMPAATTHDLGGFPDVLVEDQKCFEAAITMGCRLERECKELQRQPRRMEMKRQQQKERRRQHHRMRDRG